MKQKVEEMMYVYVWMDGWMDGCLPDSLPASLPACLYVGLVWYSMVWYVCACACMCVKCLTICNGHMETDQQLKSLIRKTRVAGGQTWDPLVQGEEMMF